VEPSQSLIRLVDVVKTFPSGSATTAALRGVGLEVGAGEFVAVIGKSGSGKTTLANMVTAIDRPTSGEVWVAETPIHSLGEGEAARWRGRTVGVVFQFFQLLPTLSLLDNVVLPMELCRLYPRRERRERALGLLEQVGMAQAARKLPSAVSGGQQQRVAIARALATDPPVLVADEPTGNLDSKTAESVHTLFGELVAGGKTVVVVTHDAGLAERATRTVLVSDGQIVNEYVRRALAALDLDQLATAFAHLQREQYAPGTVVVRQGDPADTFYIVTGGEAQVILERPGGHPVLVARLGPGEYFGEIALLRGGHRMATVRACAVKGLEVMALDRETFERVTQESDTIRHELERVIDERLGQ